MSRRLLLVCFVAEVTFAVLLAAYTVAPSRNFLIGRILNGAVEALPFLLFLALFAGFGSLLVVVWRRRPRKAPAELTDERRQWEELKTRFEQDPTAYNSFQLAAFCLRTSRYPEAVEAYRKVVAVEPDRRSARYGLGVALFRSGQVGPAITELTRVFEEEPGHDYGEIELRLAEAHLRNGDAAQALETLDRHQRARLLAEFHFLRGKALTELGRTDEARVELRRVLEVAASAPQHRKEKDRHIAQLAREILPNLADPS